MKGASSLFLGPILHFGGEAVVGGGITIEQRLVGTGLYALEVGSGHVYALVWDTSFQDGRPPVWERLP